MRKLSLRNILKRLQVKLNLFHLSIICLLLIIFFSSFSVGSRLKKLRKKRRKECMILANGPSLNQDIHLIIPHRTSYDIMVLNFFCNSEYFKILKPEYYCIADPGAFNSNKQNPILKDRIKDFIKSFNSVSWECSIFYPDHFDTSFVLDKINNPLIRKIGYNSVPVSGKSKFIFRLYANGLILPIPESVIIPAIYLMILLSFEKIHLFGVDHSWIKDFKVNNDNSSSIKLEHFGKNNVDIDNKKRIAPFMLSQHRLFQSHDILEAFAKFKRVRIINRTTNSYIDSYERLEYRIN